MAECWRDKVLGIFTIDATREQLISNWWVRTNMKYTFKYRRVRHMNMNIVIVRDIHGVSVRFRIVVETSSNVGGQ